MKKILISGGEGKFAQSILKNNKKYKIFTPNKKKMNILNLKSILNYIKKTKANYLIHSAALTSPMKQHKKKIIESINTNIIGTANIVNACYLSKIKLIYISTNFVYPGIKGNYKEEDSLLPVNAYGWSKLGGECAVRLYNKSLILRICMIDDKYPHKKAYENYITSFLNKTNAARIVLKIIDKIGIYNIGGKVQSAYKYAKRSNGKIKKAFINKKKILEIGRNTSINTNKLKKLNINNE